MQTLSRILAPGLRTAGGRVALLALFLVSLLGAWPAAAESASPRGGGFPQWLGLGVRAGYAIPGGRMEQNPESPYLYEVYSGLFALWLETSYRFDSGIEVGPWVQFSKAQLRFRCPEDAECSGNNLRLGGLVNYHFKPAAPVDPWLGLGLGYEWTRYSITDTEAAYAGPELSLQGGFDRRFFGPVWGGLFFSAAAGRYDTLNVKLGPGTGSEDLRERTMHLWITLGVRLRLAGLHAGPDDVF